jgi:rSAM/selenodomain-associated transferase 1
VAGFAKTRLIPALGAQGAAGLAQNMLRHTVHAALAARLGAVEICATPDATDSAWQNLALPEQLCWTSQGDGDLGQRMARAASRTIQQGEAVLLVGTDCPAIDASVLHKAGHTLQAHDVSLIPTFDGGYALLGLKKFDASLFSDIPWSTDVVASITFNRIQQLGWLVDTLPMMHDIDEPADLQYLPTVWNNTTTST